MHIGEKIKEVLALRHLTKQELGRRMGLTGSAATYLTTRASIDVETLQTIGAILKYNFFKHFPVKEDGAPAIASADGDEMDKLKSRVEELEKLLEACKRDLMMQKQENGYLKKINELLEKK